MSDEPGSGSVLASGERWWAWNLEGPRSGSDVAGALCAGSLPGEVCCAPKARKAVEWEGWGHRDLSDYPSESFWADAHTLTLTPHLWAAQQR